MNTMMTRKGAAACAALMVMGMTCDSARAQSAEPPAPASVRRPFRGIFGAPADPDSAHSLLFSASLFTAYDDNVLEALSNRRTDRPWLQQSGAYQGGDAGLHYTFDRGGERVTFRGNAGGQVRYYRRGETSDVLPSSEGDVVMQTRLTRSLSFIARQSLGYMSNYNFSLTPDLDDQAHHEIGSAANPDLDLFGLRALRAATSLTVLQRFGRHTSVSAGYQFRVMNLVGDARPDSQFHDYRTHAGLLGFRYSRPLSRSAEMELGYGIRVSDRRSGTGEPEVMHNLIAGVNYSRALSFSRRTSFSFGSGSAIATSERVDVAGSAPRTRLRLIGHAALVHELGRTWTVNAGYARGFLTRDGFGDLYFTDGFNISVVGLITRRLSFSAGGQWSVSSLERQGATGHRGLAATSQATYGLTRYLGLFARYVYYTYRYDEAVPLDPRIPRQLDRQGVRLGLTTTLPLIR